MVLVHRDVVEALCSPGETTKEARWVLGFVSGGEDVLCRVAAGEQACVETLLPADVCVVGATAAGLIKELRPMNGMDVYEIVVGKQLQLRRHGIPCPFSVTDATDLYDGNILRVTEVDITQNTSPDISGWRVVNPEDPVKFVYTPLDPAACPSTSSVTIQSSEVPVTRCSVVWREGAADSTAVFTRLQLQAEVSLVPHPPPRRIAAHYWPGYGGSGKGAVSGGLLHPITLVYAVQGRQAPDKMMYNKALRSDVHGCLHLPVKPLLRIAQRIIPFPLRLWEPRRRAGILRNVHLGLRRKLKGSEVQEEVVKGTYEYYHYRCDGYKDDRWGCAYRSMQTLLSWFLQNGYATFTLPSIPEIQETLFNIDPSKKDLKFVGSKEWIGSTEVWLMIEHLAGVACTVQHIESGSHLESDEAVQRSLLHHFRHHGTPVMIGGAQYAHTILGIALDESTRAVNLLILDPHYCASSSNFHTIQSDGWCQWCMPSKVFKKDSWYNLCMPRLPREP